MYLATAAQKALRGGQKLHSRNKITYLREEKRGETTEVALAFPIMTIENLRKDQECVYGSERTIGYYCHSASLASSPCSLWLFC